MWGNERLGGSFIGRSPRSRAPAPRTAPGPRARPLRYLRRASCVRRPPPARLQRHEGCASPPRGRVFLPCKKPFPRLPPPTLQDVKWRSARRARSSRLRPIPPSHRNGPEHWRPPPAWPSEPIHDIGAPPPRPSAAPHPGSRAHRPSHRSPAPCAGRAFRQPQLSLRARGRGRKHLLGPRLDVPLGCPPGSLPFPPLPLPQLLTALSSPHTQPPFFPPPVVASVTSSSWQQELQPGTEEPV